MEQIKLTWIGLLFAVLFARNSNAGSNGLTTAQDRKPNTYMQNYEAFNSSTNLKTRTQQDLQQTTSLYTVGGTYDTMSSHPTSYATCLRDGGDPNKWQIISPRSSLDFSQVQSLQTIEQALGVEYSETINAGPFSTNVAFKYGYSAQDTNYTLNINYAYQYKGIATFKDDVFVQGEDSLTRDAVALLHSSPTDFRQILMAIQS